MAKTKAKTIKAFRGQRRRVYIRSVVQEIVDREEKVMASTSKEREPSVSASAKKMELHGFDLDVLTQGKEESTVSASEKESDVDCYFIVQKSMLSYLLKTLCCPSCKQDGVTVTIDQHKGMAFSVYCSLYCTSCEQTISES